MSRCISILCYYYDVGLGAVDESLVCNLQINAIVMYVSLGSLGTRVPSNLVMMYIRKNDFQNKRLFCSCDTLLSTC